MHYVDVILPLPLEATFTYSLPPAMAAQVGVGMRVVVPLGQKKRYIAIVDRVHTDEPAFKTRPVEQLLDTHPVINATQQRLWHWMADYYLASIGDVMTAALPAGLKSLDKYKPRTERCIALATAYESRQAIELALAGLVRADKQRKAFECYLDLSGWARLADEGLREGAQEVTREELMNASRATAAVLRQLIGRGLLHEYDREVGRLTLPQGLTTSAPKALTPAQSDTLAQIKGQFERHATVLLHGITSGGKTEIYIHLIQEALSRGEQVLYLLPEIALTVQMMERLRRVFGQRLGIYHSRYTDGERVELYQKQLSEQPFDIILGARSAVFLPFQRLGLVIVDEEHETSYKQQDPAPRYHARSAAIMLAHLSGARTLLGTATPSAESYQNVRAGKYGLARLTTRYQGIELPRVEVVDVKDLRRRKMMTGLFSPRLLEAVRQAIATGHQAILFQNRRGFAPRVECRECGWTPRCKHCDVTLTLHKRLGVLTCHYCGAVYPVPQVCPECESTDVSGRGFGTEKVEDRLAHQLPEARIARMDLDTTRTQHAYERIIADFSAGRTNVLIGTQMVTKGLDFDRVSVVGILDADAMLNQPDFRASEHAFHMLSQVSGRAGRKGAQGTVILQTRAAHHPVIRQVVAHDFEGFFADLTEERRLFLFPPFCRLIDIYVRHSRHDVADHAAEAMARMLRSWFGERVLGPDKPSVGRVKNQEIRKMVLKLEPGVDMARARQYLRQARTAMEKDAAFGAIQVYFDVDPA